jgi:hypothetical protein
MDLPSDAGAVVLVPAGDANTGTDATAGTAQCRGTVRFSRIKATAVATADTYRIGCRPA